MTEHIALKELTLFENDDLDTLVEEHFMQDAWYSSDSLIDEYPDEQKLYSDIYPIYGSEAFEKKYGCDPIGCIYETHDDRVWFIAYL